MIELRSPDGTRLALHDFGGHGAPLLMLPGLCGYAGEFSATAAFLTETRRQGGWVPAFDRDIMTAMLATLTTPRWSEFAQVTCPVLVVKGGASGMTADEYHRMREHPTVTAVEIPGAGHDVHLDSPDEWRAALTRFL